MEAAYFENWLYVVGFLDFFFSPIVDKYSLGSGWLREGVMGYEGFCHKIPI